MKTETREKIIEIMIKELKSMNEEELGKALFFIQNIEDMELSFKSDEVPEFNTEDKILKGSKEDGN